MNKVITPEKFAKDVLEAMNKAEDEAGLPRGTIIKDFVKVFNTQFAASSDAKEGK